MSETTFLVPESITFEQAIGLTQTLLNQMAEGNLSDSEIEQRIAALVASENGARGFFVTYLTDERSLADQPTAGVIRALQSSPDVVVELLLKNIAMSSAMAVAHRRNQNEPMAQGSDRVRSRSLHLIQQLHSPLITEKAQQLNTSAQTGTGSYQAFLDRWGYDTEQRQAIQQALAPIVK
jgi:hypothetical protein